MIKSGKKILMIAGEPSGDLLGAPLIKELKKENSESKIYGIGGDLMIKEGLENIFHIEQLSIMGFTEILKSIPFLKKVFNRMKKELRVNKPDIVVLIDYPGFNLRFARMAKKSGCKVFYYVSPQVWAWRKNRINIIAKYVDMIAVIFKFEEELYKQKNVNVKFVSHPILERIKVNLTKKEFFALHNLDDSTPVIGLLPGSRKQEIQKMFPIMLNAALKMRENHNNLQILVANLSTLEKSIYTDIIKNSSRIVLAGEHIYELMKYSTFLVVASGTATLESAYLETPMIIVYKTSPVTFFLGKRLVKLPYIGMINILAGKSIVPELIQKKFTPENVAASVLDYLNNPVLLNSVKDELKKTKNLLGEGSASKQTAALIIKELEKDES